MAIVKRVEVEIDISEISIFELIQGLKEKGCPEHLMVELLEWANQPIPDLHKLERWLN